MKNRQMVRKVRSWRKRNVVGKKYLLVSILIVLVLGGCAQKDQSKISGEKRLGREIFDCGISLSTNLNGDFSLDGEDIYFSALDKGHDGKLRLSIYRGNAFSEELFVDTDISVLYQTDMLWLARHIQGNLDGGIYLLQDDHEQSIVINEYKDNEQLEEFLSIPRNDIQGNHVSSFAMNSEGNVLILVDQQPYGYSLKDGLIAYETPHASIVLKVFAVEDKFYCLVRETNESGKDGQKIYLYHGDGTINKNMEIPLNSTALTALSSEMAFYVEGSGLYSIDSDLSTCKSVVDLSNEKKIWNNIPLIVKKGDSFGFVYQSLADQAYRTMVFDEKMSQTDKVIELKLYDPTGYIEYHCPMEIIDSFNELYPNYHVSIMEDQREMQYVLFSDEKPDLIILDEENMCLLGKEGYLEDLNELLKADSSKLQEELLDGLLEKISFEQHVFGLPKRIKIRTVCAKTSKVNQRAGWTTDEFLDWMIDQAEALKDSRIYRIMLLQYCLEGGMDQYIDYQKGECHFDAGDFSRHLRKISEINENHQDGVVSSETGELRYIGVEGVRTLLVREDSNDPWVYKGYPSFDGRERHKLTFDAMSILKTSTNKEAAYVFLNYFVRYRYWENYYFYAYKPLFLKITELEKKNYWEVENGADLRAIGQKEIDLLEQLYNHAEMSDVNSWNIMAIILEEAKEYLEKNKEMEVVIDHIQNRVGLLLKENN